MDTTESMEKQEVVRQAMSILGRAKTERKLAALAMNRTRFIGHSEETKTRLRASQQARRERERADREALGLVKPATEKRPPGRPSTRPKPDADAPKQPRGRPKKQGVTESLQGSLPSENGK